MLVVKFVLFFCFLMIAANANAQTFGFGCLGFVGGFGGYSYQQYNPQGLNDYIQSFNANHSDSLSSPLGKFGKAQGYRIGINFFRAEITGFILTTKGFYQNLIEKNQTSINYPGGSASIINQLELTNWGLGIDLGTSITGALSWKVIDAALLYTTASYTNTTNSPGPSSVINKYNSENPSIGYSVGTGFILDIIDQYISLEGTAGFTSFSVGKMISADGTELKVNENSNVSMKNFISNGGFNAEVQLNVGFPL
ncbi:MAG: hypothetical protein ACYDA4_08840 [Ignavibacteriaceae bacterium]